MVTTTLRMALRNDTVRYSMSVKVSLVCKMNGTGILKIRLQSKQISIVYFKPRAQTNLNLLYYKCCFITPGSYIISDKVYTNLIVVAFPNKHLKKSNAACFYTPVVLKLLIIVQM